MLVIKTRSLRSFNGIFISGFQMKSLWFCDEIAYEMVGVTMVSFDEMVALLRWEREKRESATG